MMSIAEYKVLYKTKNSALKMTLHVPLSLTPMDTREEHT